ncbi:hypothetical protein vseg_003535 [Gypsophila vaccaria]
MGILHDDVVVMSSPEKEGDPTVITVNCPDKLGLGCDLCHILLSFGLYITRVDFATDGKWCYIVMWVTGKPTIRWGLVKKRLFCCHDRRGLLHDVTEVLCELELYIQRVKVSTTPDGKVLDLFFITDTRELMHTKRRQEDTKERLQTVLGDTVVCDIEKVDAEVSGFSQASTFLRSGVTDEAFNFEDPDKEGSALNFRSCNSISVDNSLSPSHTLIQIVCRDYTGLLYDLMRTLKDYNIQIAYGRGATKQNRNCEIDLFVVQADGKKIVDSNKQSALCSRLSDVLGQPVKIAVVSRGPDTELLVANPVELSGRGRPLVIYHVTLALKSLNICVFSAEIGRHIIEHRECEVYRFLLHEADCLLIPRKKIKERVWQTLMGGE